MGPANLDYDSLDGMGFFYQAYYDDDNKHDFLGCIQYKVDASWSGAAAFKASRVFGVVLAMISTLLLVMVNMMVLFLRFDHRRRLLHFMIRVIIPIAFVCSIFTLAVFSMDECQKDNMQCPPGTGGVVAIINMFVFALLSVLVFLAPTPSQPVFALFKDVKPTRSKRTRSKQRSKKVTFEDPREPRPNRALPVKSKRRRTHHRKKPRPSAPAEPAQFRPEEAEPPSETFSDTGTCSSEHDQEIIEAVANSAEPDQEIIVGANPNWVDTGTSIQVDVIPAGRRTVTTCIHPDGSKTITCKIHPISERERMDPGV
jgi:hypothetical protein